MNKIIIVLTLILVLSGCISIIPKRAVEKVALNSSLGEVIKAMGSPKVIKGVITNKHGEKIEVLEYNLTQEEVKEQLSYGLLPTIETKEAQNYWLYFIDNRLVKTKEATNWGKEVRNIRRFNFGTGE